MIKIEQKKGLKHNYFTFTQNKIYFTNPLKLKPKYLMWNIFNKLPFNSFYVCVTDDPHDGLSQRRNKLLK